MAPLEWLEVSVAVIPEAAEAVAEVLSRYAPQGVVIDLGTGDDAAPHPVTVKAYLVADDDIATRRQQVAEGLWHLHHIWPVIPEPVFTPLADRDWTAGWKESIPVMHLGKRVVIKPSWREYTPQPGEIVLEMDPGMAFGTGLHPTTQLCVEVLEELVRPGMRVLDLGTGTGILSLVAARLDAAEILAVDNDINAVAVARRNAQVNAVAHKIRLLHGSLAGVGETYDLIAANILAHTIVDMAQAGLATRLRRDGVLVASGILEEQAAAVETVLLERGLQVIERRQREEWMALIARARLRPA
ncbi:MAG TPA: 50S ribosomal protein L11 methyltransferase [Anaerolineae bacterium]|nr:50S ribosomal protein L11 methyltransferase [Anaerolineae bacterium]HQH38762.1 50S ribosomal protein L11 methyltransferase [Anaerolineae bacterium]